MDPDLIRLVLLICGVALVAGIYLWDRYKRSQQVGGAYRRRARHATEPTVAETTAPSSEPSSRPSAGTSAEAGPPPAATSAEMVSPHDDESPVEVSAPTPAERPLDPEPRDLGDWSMTAGDDDPQFSMDLAFDAHDDGDYLHGDAAVDGSVERMIIAIGVSALGKDMAGDAVAAAAAKAGLLAGEMSIFHWNDPATGRALFSMASMVEPGTFPFDDMARFRTPGLTLFTQLPGARDGVEIFDRMLSTAELLAKALEGEIQDDRRNKLTGQMREHLREAIIEHRQRVRLARSRH